LVPKLKKSAPSAISSAGQRRARRLDHRADLVVDVDALLFEDLLGDGLGARRRKRSSIAWDETSGIMISGCGSRCPSAGLVARGLEDGATCIS
jgi:hypothetical protein